MAFEIYDKKGKLLETIDDDSQFDVILKEGESESRHPIFSMGC